MTETTASQLDGLVLYTDGSFRDNQGGWGLHGYTYRNVPLEDRFPLKQKPTIHGYAEVDNDQTVTPVEYIESYATLPGRSTNNIAELQAMIEAFKLALTLEVPRLHIRSDSEYVRLGLTRHLPKWVANQWRKADGEPVLNQEYWKELMALEAQWKALGREVNLQWVKGHNGEHGNETVDQNALLGSAATQGRFLKRTPAADYYAKITEANPLIMKTRMVFNLGIPVKPSEGPATYYIYHLGSSRTYGAKQHDTWKDKHNKTDLLFGRRISDCTFSVLKLKEPDPFLENLIDYHRQTYTRDIVELAVARLDNAYRPGTVLRLRQMGIGALAATHDNRSLITADRELVTKTLDPPRLAFEAAGQFAILDERLTYFLEKGAPEGITAVDITSTFYDTEGEGAKAKTKLHKEITTATQYLEVPVNFRGQAISLRLVPGIDIPQRNPLAKIADLDPKVTLLVIADGPAAYSFAVVFETSLGSAIFQSPYTRFVLPDES